LNDTVVVLIEQLAISDVHCQLTVGEVSSQRCRGGGGGIVQGDRRGAARGHIKPFQLKCSGVATPKIF